MKEFYKLYIGKETKKGMPDNCTSYGIVSRETLVPKVKYLAKTLQEGLDLYIVSDKTQAYKRDRLDKIFDWHFIKNILYRICNAFSPTPPL